VRAKLLLAAALTLAACSREEVPCPCYAIDGDTFVTAAGEHIRLAVIDAPEMPGHCRPGRHCVQGDPYAAQAALQHLLNSSPWLFCEWQKKDRYGRTIAECYDTRNTGNSYSQLMLGSGTVGLYEP
jgi:micrococcal nuclease